MEFTPDRLNVAESDNSYQQRIIYTCSNLF